MPGTVLTNARIIVGGSDISGFSNQVEVTYGAEILDASVFKGGSTRINTVGLLTVMVTGRGLMEATNVDAALYNAIGVASEIISVAPVGDLENDITYFTKGISGTYQPVSGEIGALMEFELNFSSAGYPLLRGQVAAIGSKVASGSGTGFQIVGGVPAEKRLYASLHVTAFTGTPTIDMVVESDDNAGFTTPTTQITLAQLAAKGAVWGDVAGPITDDWYRMTWTIAGGSPNVTVYGAIAVF